MGRRGDLSEKTVHQFTHVDYKKDFGLAAFVDHGDSGAIIGVGRYAYDRENERPELAVVVRDDWQGKGLGTLLLESRKRWQRKWLLTFRSPDRPPEPRHHEHL